MPRKLTTKEFINKAIGVHGDIYDYSKVVYSGIHHKVCIICSIHGEFYQTPDNHIHGRGCRKCGLITKSTSCMLTTDTFIEKAINVHHDRYDYSNTVYTGTVTKVLIGCPMHGNFLQSPSEHLRGCGCMACGHLRRGEHARLSTDMFITKAVNVNGFRYKYDKVDYIGTHDDVIITCPIHGDFEQSPNNHLSGKGCPKCSESKGEYAIRNFLELNNIKFYNQYRTQNCVHIRELSFDFYIPSKNLLIEYDGKQHFEPVEYFGGVEYFEECTHRDVIKDEYATKFSITLLRIPYWDIDNIDSILKSHLF